MIVMEAYPGFFVGWGTLALLNTALAQLQGRSALLWLCISLMLGPVATLLLIIFYKKRINTIIVA